MADTVEVEVGPHLYAVPTDRYFARPNSGFIFTMGALGNTGPDITLSVDTVENVCRTHPGRTPTLDALCREPNYHWPDKPFLPDQIEKVPQPEDAYMWDMWLKADGAPRRHLVMCSQWPDDKEASCHPVLADGDLVYNFTFPEREIANLPVFVARIRAQLAAWRVKDG